MRYAVALVPFLAFLTLSCGGDEETAAPTATASPVAPTATPEAAGQTLAFIRDGDVWLINASGSNERRLGLVDVQSFSWVSRDELDVVSGADSSGHLLVDLEGNATELPFPAGGSWSRDGTRYVVPVDELLVLFNRDGSEAGRLDVEPPVEMGEKASQCGGTLPDSGRPDRLLFSRPALSPDNEQVVVAVNCQSRMAAVGNLLTQVVVLQTDGSGQRPLGELQINVGSALAGTTFSSDGAHVAAMDTLHVSACAGVWGLQVVDIDGAAVTPIIVAAATARFPERSDPRGGVVGYDWSPDGVGVIAAVNLSACRHVDVEPGLVVEPVVKGLYTVRLDGSEELLVDGPTRSPAWSPSGQYVAYVMQESFGEVTEPPLLRVIDVTTREVTDLGQGTQPAWQPDRARSLDAAEAAATAVAGSGDFSTAQEAIATFGEAWVAPFLGDCDALAQPQTGSCLAADRTVEEATATYRLCRPGVDACLLVALSRSGAGVWTISSVTAYGGPTEEQLVP